MNKQLFYKWIIFSCFLSLAVICFPVSLRAQQRYLGVSLVNENDDPELEIIQKAKDVGINAVLLSIQWGSIEGKLSRILKQENGESYNVWQQYDDQIAFAKSLGMKVAINISVGTGDDVTNSTTDRYGVDTGDGWLKEERILNVNYNGDEAVLQRYGGPIRPNVNLQFVMTSLAAQSTQDRIVNFTNKVIQRYKYLQDSNDLLYVDLIFTRQGEGEFEVGTTKYDYNQQMDMDASLTDYSQPIVSGYRGWLTGKYGNISALNTAWGASYQSFDKVNPKRPSNSTFVNPDGTDWFLYRTHLLKDANNLFKNTVKGINPNIKVISHHGSVYDRLSRSRGTLFFNEIARDLDGVKINDDVYYDSRFALDLLRTNLPGKLYVNEMAYLHGIDNVIKQASESYTHGAHVVTIMFLDRLLTSADAVASLKSFSSQWVTNKQVTTPVASNTDSFSLSGMILKDGCVTNRDNYSNDCDAYKTWRTAYDNSGNKPVNIFLNNDLPSTSLPVTLVTFAAKKQENVVTLDWQTSEESNSDYFEIQHSINGKQWTKLGMVTSLGEGKVIRHYTYSHDNPAPDQNLYRLKMVDMDGSFSFSKIASVKFEGKNDVVLYPNPVSNGVIKVRYSGTLPDIALTDSNGRTIQVTTERADSGELVVKTKSRLTSGLYILTTGYGATLIKHKVIFVN